MKRMLALAVAFLGTTTLFATVEGTVFWDANGNGTRDAGEKPCAGVAVSDMLNVTKTDAEGRFTLPADHGKARFVALSVPNGARVARHWIPIAKDKAAGYDFALTPWAPSDKGAHTFIQITDTEMSGGAQPHYRAMAEELRRLATEEKAAFVIHTGDICYARGLKEHQALFKDLGVPLFWCNGNHDLVAGPYGEALFESLYGPTWYSFNAGGTHYVALPMPGGDRRPSYTTAEVAAWLRNDLAAVPAGTPLVVFCHDLLFTGNTFDYGGVDLLAHNLKAWLYGHWHINHIRRQGNVLTIGTNAPEKGGIDSAASAFRVMHLDADGTPRSDLRYAPLPTGTPTRDATVWSAPAGGEILFSSPVAADGLILVGTVDENLLGEGGVTAFDPATGKQRWRAKTRASVKNAIAAADGRVFAQDADGWVYAFATKDGAKLWERKLPNAPLPGLVSGVTLADGTLYAGAGQSLTAFDPATGKKKWQGGGWRLREGTPDRPAVADGAVILGSHWDALCATDAATGRLLWRKADADFRFRGSVAAPDGKTIWVPTRNKLFQIEARTGKILKQKDLGFSVENGGQPLLTETLILLTSVDTGLVALNRETLAEAWRLPVGEGLVYTAPYSHRPQRPIQGSAVRAGDTVYVAASDGCVYAADLPTGKQKWKKSLGTPLLGTPLVAGDRLYVADLAGTVHCLPLN